MPRMTDDVQMAAGAAEALKAALAALDGRACPEISPPAAKAAVLLMAVLARDNARLRGAANAAAETARARRVLEQMLAYKQRPARCPGRCSARPSAARLITEACAACGF